MRTFNVLIFLLVITLGCASKIVNTDRIRDMQENKVTKQTGVVDFWKAIGKYTISYSPENTMDNRRTCVVPQEEMIPKELQEPGTKVVFSGTITKDSRLPAPRMGGEEIFLLIELESINSFSNN